jgi:hypothetical protein
MHETHFWEEKTVQFILEVIRVRSNDHSKKLLDEALEREIITDEKGVLSDTKGRKYMIKQGQIIKIR